MNNRYKYTEKGISETVSYLKGASKDAPAWAKRFKSDLKVVGKRVHYKGIPIIPVEKVNDYLRDEMFKKDGTLPFGRDAAHHLLKTTVLGVTRRHLMRFIKSQNVFEETKAALPKPRSKGGAKLKTYTFEADLVFIRKNDLVNNGGKRFERTVQKEETYMVSVCEKITGICRLSYVRTKLASVVTPAVIKHIRSIAKDLQVHPRTCSYRSDSGGEFSMAEIRAVVPDAKNVGLASSVEKKNQDAQRTFYRILKTRRAMDIPTALQETQKLLNNTYNRIQGATPNEVLKEKTKKLQVKGYNKKRATYIAGDTRKPFEVGQKVRIQIKKDKSDLSYKAYKGVTYSRRVYAVTKVTKTTPRKYRVNRVWYTADKLKSTETEDEKTKDLIESRDAIQAVADKELEDKQEAWEKEKAEVMAVVKQIEIAEGTRRSTRRGAVAKQQARMKKQQAKMELLDKVIAVEEERVRQSAIKAGVAPPGRKVKVRGRKYEEAGEEEWQPSPKKRKRRPKKRIKRV